MASLETGFKFGGAILDALGVAHLPTDRIVVVVEIHDVPRVYLRSMVPVEALPGIVQAVKDVQVSATGDVTVTPFAAEELPVADAVVEG